MNKGDAVAVEVLLITSHALVINERYRRLPFTFVINVHRNYGRNIINNCYKSTVQ